MADAAHELRTPQPTSRSTNIEVIGSDPSAGIDEYRAMAASVERSVARMERLVNDLLVLAAEERTAERTVVALEPLLEDIVSGLKQTAAHNNITLALADTAHLRLRRCTTPSHVFTNIIENGIRYNRVGGRVSICAEGDGAWIAVRISDTGIGIAPDEHERIFERFYRVEQSRARHKGGVGLGLSIVAHILQQHGTITVESRLNEDSTFIIRLPAAHLNRDLTTPVL